MTTEELDEEPRTARLPRTAAGRRGSLPAPPPPPPPPPPLDRSHTEPLVGDASPTVAPPRRVVLDRYRLERRLGAGGFGVVWLAFDERLEREVAVKVIPHDGDGSDPVPGRAGREARAAARLNHPGIVALYELASDDEAVYLVSELVPGRTLAELLRAGAVSDRDVARIGTALCEALEHAHRRKVIHRDVKPQNVIVVAEPAAGAGFAKLADFGVAHLATGDPMTRTGDVVGTLAYMAPEQAEGQRVTSAADVYSLALTLYEAWTGRNPVRADNPAATARRVGMRLPPLGGVRRDLPIGLCRTIDAALDPDPEGRPPLDVLRGQIAAVAKSLSDVGGLVEPGTLERLGLTRVREAAAAAPHAPLTPLVTRAAAGLAAGLLFLVGLQQLGPSPPVAPVAAAAGVALLVGLLPRVGWIAGAAAMIGWLASPDAGMQGTALILTVALAPVPLLLPRAGLLWSVPVLAPLLGAIAVAPLYVAIAGLARTPWRRAGLGAAGFLWLACAELLTDDPLLFGIPDGATVHAAWEGSFGTAASDALWPLVSSPALAPFAIWAALAAVLPFVVRGRSLALDVIGGAIWATALAAAHFALTDPLASQVAATAKLGTGPRGAIAGAALAFVLVVIAPRSGLVETSRDAPERVPVEGPPFPRIARQ